MMNNKNSKVKCRYRLSSIWTGTLINTPRLIDGDLLAMIKIANDKRDAIWNKQGKIWELGDTSDNNWKD